MTKDEFQGFVVDNWWKVAGTSWMGYQESGRGFVHLFVDDTQLLANGEHPMLMSYIPKKALRSKGLGLKPESVVFLKDKIRIYEPTRDVVVGLSAKSSDGELWATRLAVTNYPPEQAYKEHIGELDNFIMSKEQTAKLIQEMSA